MKKTTKAVKITVTVYDLFLIICALDAYKENVKQVSKFALALTNSDKGLFDDMEKKYWNCIMQ